MLTVTARRRGIGISTNPSVSSDAETTVSLFDSVIETLLESRDSLYGEGVRIFASGIVGEEVEYCSNIKFLRNI